ncbi:hypothetical protein SASPL_115133 [Salvia splendens]|uniref:RNase H type-1 domain-containing protein n=1 Tax=Salvia splendens TaxID=180675 RepID=A0A8X8Y7F1_SALSN|nr:uncharacterized protein LOC121804116 [Salvia splendens]KAG6424713.1 hypothetical protein SASPL_115133 [Salvia splendens]
MGGGGGVIRDDRGRILGGFAEPLRAESAKETELTALNRGLEIAKGLGSGVWIETDSLEMVNLITKESRGAAQIRHLLTDIRNKLRGLNFKITHICREGNKVADYLAKQGGNREDRITFDQDSAPPMVKILARMDRMGIPSVRE